MKKLISIFLVLLMFFTAGNFTAVQADTFESVTIPNAGFEELSENFIAGWGACVLNGTPYAFSDTERVHSGKRSLKVATTISNMPWANTTVTGLVPGGIYEISAWINAMIESDGQSGVVFKFEFMDEKGKGIGEHFTDEYLQSTNALWVQHSAVFTVPEGATKARLYCRLLCNGMVWFDDVELRYIGEPEKYSFEIGDVFHYPEEEQGFATVSLASYYLGKPVETEGVVDFELRDGDKILHSQRNTHFKDLKAEYTYDISLLKEKQKAYTVTATARWGTEEKVFKQNVYVFDRPSIIGEDGIIRFDGEVFTPVYGYHVFDDYEIISECGINVVQFGMGGGENYTEAHLAECDRLLDELDKNGMKALFVLYDGMVPASHERNLQYTKTYVERFKDDPRIFAWAVMDEPFAIRDAGEMSVLMEEAYTMIRSVDSMHPINITDFSELGPKYCDIYTLDNYAYADNRSVTRYHNETLERNKGKVYYTYLAATFTLNGVFQTIPGLRGSVYRAYESGMTGIGYFGISDGYIDENGERYALYDIDFWKPFCAFNNNELPILRDIFAYDKYTKVNEYIDEDIIEGDYWSTWTDGKVIYMIVHNKSMGKRTITVPLKSANGLLKIGAHTIERVGGTVDASFFDDSYKITLSAQDVAMFKITPEKSIDISVLTQSPFMDLEGYDWAKADIEAMYADGVLNMVGDNLYGPAQNITRADFAMFLVRTLGLTAAGQENFADVDPNAYYAKELAIGRALGILKGVDGVNFNPDSEISRQDLMTICHRGMEFAKKKMEDNPSALDAFSDKDIIAEYAREAVRLMAGSGIVKGDENGNVNPFGNATRAEAAVIMNRIKNTEDDVTAAPPAQEPDTEPELEAIPDTTLTPSSPSDAQLKAWEESIAFLKTLGIIEGELSPTGKVSRGESAKLFVKTQGITADLKTGETPFVDVPSDSAFAGFIESMYKQGFMNGVTADRFVPENSLTYNQAVKILVSILGYAPHAESSGAFPAGYLSIASRIDLLDGTTPDGDAPIQLGALAKLIHNALGIDLVRPSSYGEDASGELTALENCTLLSEYFNIKKYKGKLTANYYTKLENDIKLSKTQVAMGDLVFEGNGTRAADFVGQEVILYAKDNDEKEIVDISVKKSAYVMEILGETVLSETSETTFVYEDVDGKTLKNEIGGATLVYNGKVKTGWTRDDLLGINGTISLICNNGNSADVILVWNYKNYVVEKVNTKEDKVYFKDGSYKILDTENRDTKTLLIDASGTAVDLAGLAEWNILSIAENTNLIKAVYSNKKVQGEVTETGKDTVWMQENMYKISPVSSVSPVLGKTETFYLDFMDNIVIKDDAMGDVTYGYFVAVSKDKGLSGNVKVKIYTTDNKMQVFETAKSIEYNNERGVNNEVLLSAPELFSGEVPKGQLVVYETNDADEIISLTTARDCIGKSEEERLSAFSLDVQTTDGGPYSMRGYPSSGGRLLGALYRVTEKTILFKVPELYSDNPKDYKAYDHMAIQHANDLMYTDFYDVDENYIVSVLVQKAPSYEKGGNNLAVIEGFRIGLNADGNPQKGISIVTNTGEKDVLYVEDDFDVYFGERVITDLERESETEVSGGQKKLKETIPVDKLKPGDVIRYNKLDNGTVNGIEVLLRAEHPVYKELAGDRAYTSEFNNYHQDTRAFGKVEKVMKDSVIMTPTYKRNFVFDKGSNGTTKVLLFDMEKNQIKEISPMEIYVNDNMFIFKSNIDVEMAIVYR